MRVFLIKRMYTCVYVDFKQNADPMQFYFGSLGDVGVECDPRTSTELGDVSTSTDSNDPLCRSLATEEELDMDIGSESGVEVEPSTSQLSVERRSLSDEITDNL